MTKRRQALHDWPEAKPNAQGDFPYKQMILRYQAYLTPEFRQALLNEYQTLLNSGHLDRTREMYSTVNAAQITQSVKRLTCRSWEVMLDVTLIERTRTMEVKHATIRYPLRVVRYAINHTANPYGLALAGFVRPPERLESKGQNLTVKEENAYN